MQKLKTFSVKIILETRKEKGKFTKSVVAGQTAFTVKTELISADSWSTALEIAANKQYREGGVTLKSRVLSKLEDEP